MNMGHNDEIAIVALMVLGAIALLFIEAFLGLWVWNWIMPLVFGLPELSFWQFWGICFLGHMIFPSPIVRKNRD